MMKIKGLAVLWTETLCCIFTKKTLAPLKLLVSSVLSVPRFIKLLLNSFILRIQSLNINWRYK